MKKRCICGQSETFPLCDGRHGAQGWGCSPTEHTHTERVIMGSAHYLSLVEYLGHKHSLPTLHQQPQLRSCDELIIIHDGHQLEALTHQAQSISHQARRVISIGAPLPRSLASSDMPCHSFEVTLDEVAQLKDLHATVQSLLNAPPPQQRLSSVNVFISHAVRDEGLLMPSVQKLRAHYGLSIFVCSDSITLGEDWYTQIERNLRESDLVIALGSRHAYQSTFCAFEMGIARALDLPIYPVLLDDAPPPTYLQHLNAVSVERILNASPWLSRGDGLTQGIFMCLQSFNAQGADESVEERERC